MELNATLFQDKVYACWIGKNIGGTMGTPYEGQREMQNIRGFVTKPNEVLPNDDLDLQLVWLEAVEKIGPYGLDCKKLGEFWCSFIVPFWNEYGIGKTNMQRGLHAPLSGDYGNAWKNSNGAWIRTEIWASLAPACPDVAAKYAIEDAKVDHGAGEGTIAAAFVAAMQSAAFAVENVRTCIDVALGMIPERSRLAASIRRVTECYESGVSPRDAREIIQKMNADIGDGWFEAPSNVAYAVLGLLYGEGDFKKTMFTAINCGDDTDCTGATVGATLGILNGTAGIPEDWRAYLGDSIVTISLNRTSGLRPPKNCAELTERVTRCAPIMLLANHANVSITDGPSRIPANVVEIWRAQNKTKAALERMEPYSFTTEFAFCTATAIWDGAPEIKQGEIKRVTLRFSNRYEIYGNTPYYLNLRWLLPEGFTVEGGKNSLRLPHFDAHDTAKIEETFILRAGGVVLPVNRIVVEVVADHRPTTGYIPLVLLG